MTKRMLIDDTQPEETRVVVMDGAKIEDVEFESSFRRQIKGNIYLAKVMRIEPSLQAAFVDYGGNRHGFLAFGEIHPDYYNVSDEVLHACEQEADEIIENKKQIAKEREIERTRRAEARAARRAKYLAEMEALKQEEDKKQEAAADENKEEQAPLNDDTSSSQDELAIEVVLPDATNAPAHPRRGRRAKKALTEDNAEAKENKEAPVSEEENDEAKTQEQAPRRGRRRKAPKTLSDSEGI
ncbi:MAG: S1 RNA-binding domain-containing protein, partial [Alphaproteobacteria bacterium]|nr:S1 RNA-binding domain-containing protein [Alphaproteobacteria bacterium]